jgi:MFS family permease
MKKENVLNSLVGSEPRSSAISSLLPMMGALFVIFLVTGIALPALPLYVHDTLGLGAFAVGLVGGVQFLASLVSRVWAGVFSDKRGPKQAVIVGLSLAVASGFLYLSSTRFAGSPGAAVILLLIGRGVLGAAESFVIVGAQSWGLALAGSSNTGRVIAWLGMAMYGAFAAGAPLGSALFQNFGFAAIAIATVVTPVAAAGLIGLIEPVELKPRQRASAMEVAKAIWAPGAALALSSVGFGVMTAYAVLLFVERGFEPAWLSYTIFAAAFMAARLWLGSLPDRRGGGRVATAFILVEAIGFLVIWASKWSSLAFLGAALVGFGYSLVFPGLGVEAVRRAPPEARGVAVGVYTAFLDVALGILIPLLGLVGARSGLGSIFFISAALTLLSAPIAASLGKRKAGARD